MCIHVRVHVWCVHAGSTHVCMSSGWLSEVDTGCFLLLLYFYLIFEGLSLGPERTLFG